MNKDIRYGSHCSLCGKKISFMDKNYTHKLSDGSLCSECNMKLVVYLSEQNDWVSKEEYKENMQAKYNWRQEHCMPLAEAKSLLLIRDKIAQRHLQSVKLESGSVFTVQETFQMPKSPAIFILRAIKVKNKAVLQGFSLKGEIRKGDNVTLNINGNLQTIKALDVIPNGTAAFNKSSFFDLLSTNVHNHKIKEAKLGWIIIDTEDIEGIQKDGFVATLPKK